MQCSSFFIWLTDKIQHQDYFQPSKELVGTARLTINK